MPGLPSNDSDKQKRCPRCQRSKPLVEFYRSSATKDGRQGHCKACNREILRERAALQPRKSRVRVSAPAGYKWCADCDAIKPADEFPRNRNSGDGLAQYCKPCHNARGRESKIRLYGGTRHYHLKRRYGIGADEVEAMAEAQGGLCAICKIRPPEHVDHDHTTGSIRGILCGPCNQGLGQFRDDRTVLMQAHEYLRRQDPVLLQRDRLNAAIRAPEELVTDRLDTIWVRRHLRGDVFVESA